MPRPQGVKGQSIIPYRAPPKADLRRMPRPPRIEYGGAFHHVMARGDRREPIVLSDRDRCDLVETLGGAGARTVWRVYARALMDNRFHWLLETPEPNLVEGLRWFQNTYARRFNRRIVPKGRKAVDKN